MDNFEKESKNFLLTFEDQSAKNEILKKKITSNGRITSFSKQQLKKIKNKISLKGNEAASNYTESNESQAIEKIRSYVLHLIDEESKKPKKPTKKTNSRSARVRITILIILW